MVMMVVGISLVNADYAYCESKHQAQDQFCPIGLP